MVHGDFIIGLPGETRQSAQRTLDFIFELKPNMLQVAYTTPIPGTEFYNWANEIRAFF
jgi:tRNA A37 methylthiotransferase MiaB